MRLQASIWSMVGGCRMSSDPLGLSPEQRAQSNQAVIIERFVRRYGDRIKLAADGTWYVEDGDLIRTIPRGALPLWPSDDVAEDAGKTLNECVAIAESGQ